MKKLLLVLIVAGLAGCAKTNEDIAKDLIHERLKTTLPDFDKYESVNHGKLGKAFLPFEETDTYVATEKSIKAQTDSITMIEARLAGTPAVSPDSATWYKQTLAQLQSSRQALREGIGSGKMAYVPQQLFKLTHTYKIKEASGIEKSSEDAYYFDTAVTRIIKVAHIK